MNYQKCASEIIKNIGGKDNISHLEHCSTRLRFTLYDNSKVNIESLEKIDGVLGVRQNVQTQIIIGNEVNEVYDQVASLVGDINENGSSTTKKKQNYGAIFLDFLVSIFQPLVPAIAGGGVLKSLLLLLQLFGWVN
ncbi:PTS transporter subunit EIIB, partial [Enterococcus cecorum]|nr:PTS transporter subunit EIIB [Enterococcus cecorum]